MTIRSKNSTELHQISGIYTISKQLLTHVIRTDIIMIPASWRSKQWFQVWRSKRASWQWIERCSCLAWAQVPLEWLGLAELQPPRKCYGMLIKIAMLPRLYSFMFTLDPINSYTSVHVHAHCHVHIAVMQLCDQLWCHYICTVTVMYIYSQHWTTCDTSNVN